MSRFQTLAAVVVVVAAFVAQSAQATLIHRWSFNDGTANDSVGTAHGTLFGGTVIGGGRLPLDGVNDYMQSLPLTNNVTARTLMAWVSLTNLPQQSGGLLTIENPTGSDIFDSIVYGERTQFQWMNGSTGFARSNPANNGGALEGVTEPGEVMMAIRYVSSSLLEIYRNGTLYATTNPGSLITYTGGVADALIGLRHADLGGGSGTATGNDGFLAGFVNEARIYDEALSPQDIALFAALGPNLLTVPVPEPGTFVLLGLGLASMASVRRTVRRRR